MTPHTINNYSVLIPDIPEGATVYRVHQLKTAWLLTDVNPIPLPPGDWQLYRLSSVPEELAGEMVEKNRNLTYKCYDNKNYDMMTAHASFTSWVRAQGVEGDCYLLIKKTETNQ